MAHLPSLIFDLTLILTAAAIVTLIFKKLRQPVVLGYLLAGVLVSPHFSFLPSVIDGEGIAVWGELGVIIMLFGLGLEFSFRKLAQVGKSASITASFEILFMLGLGTSVALLLGWEKLDAVFLGGILSISSTTIIVRAFEELNLKKRGFTSLVFGVLIVEDLLAVLLLVLLTSVAKPGGVSAGNLFFSAGRLLFFLITWFLAGIYLIPLILKKLRQLLADETLLIVSLGLCLIMVTIAHYFGFSAALGAFVMGSLLSETPEGHRIESLIVPIKDLFSAVFFVSVGMLIDPQILKDSWGLILLFTGVTIFGKVISTSLGALVSGESLKHSVQAGMSLAQIGEFSFIIAGLGVTLNATNARLYPVAVAVSALTTFATPYLIRSSGPLHTKLTKILPQNFLSKLAQYEAFAKRPSHAPLVSLLWSAYGKRIILNSVCFVAIILTGAHFITADSTQNYLILCGAVIVSSPFLWAVVAKPPLRGTAYESDTTRTLIFAQPFVAVLRFLMGVALLGFAISQFTSLFAATSFILIAVIFLVLVFFKKIPETLYDKLEHRFIDHLTESERAAAKATLPQNELAPWDAQLVPLQISADSEFAGKTITEAQIRKLYGVTFVLIERGQKRIFSPGPHEFILPYDKIFAIGTDEQIENLSRALASQSPVDPNSSLVAFRLESYTVRPGDLFESKLIKDCGLKAACDGLIVGVERGGLRILNPDAQFLLNAQDKIWIVGDHVRFRALLRASH